MHKKGKLFVLSLVVCMGASASNSPGSEAKTKKLTSGVSVNIRNNKRGGKVDLTKAPGYKEALMDFYKGRYGPAARALEQLDSHGFCCDMVHYYIAQSYHHLNQLALAGMHYNWVSSYSKDPTLRQYAQSASLGLDYYGSHRTYAGQGNNFERVASRGGGGGGGGGGGFG